ncbi:MAG: hypothetical protein R3264_19995, partial [Anaerolineae bacterium]|nr:hypothetical protein [Anaerolineae bacterium]
MMIKMKNWTFLSLLPLLLLAACTPPGRGNTGPTPTIGRLDGDAPPGPAIAVAAGPTATATITPIPPPSATAISNPTATAPPAPIDPTVTASPTSSPMAQVDDLPVIEVTETSGAGVDPVTSAARPVSQPPGNATSSQLIFATRSGGDLIAVNIDGTGLRRLTGGVIDPAVSPDGQQVAFTRWDSGEVGTLFVINIDGSNERAILGETLQAKSPTWSPDGQSIVVSFQQGGLRNPGEECRSFDADDGIRLPDDISEITHTSFSNGELKICFIRREDLQWLLRQVDVTSGRFEDLPVDLYSYTPAWDPQNAWRVIYDGERGLMQLDV